MYIYISVAGGECLRHFRLSGDTTVSFITAVLVDSTMSTTESDDDLECLVCELVQDIEHEDDEPILHAVAGVHDVDVPYASPSTYICSECLAQFIEWKVERSVMVWVADYLQPEIRDEIDEAVSEILEDYDAAIYDGEFRNAMTARDDAEPITDIN